MSKNFLLVLVAIVLILAGIFMFGNNTKDPASNGNSNQTSNHVKGEKKMGVTLLEYGDYQCPVCGAYYPVVKEVVEKYGDNIAFQFKNLPLPQIHPNAFSAARAAEAAGKQNKFWEMHDMLFERQPSWSTSSSPYATFESYAKQLNLDIAKFKQDYQSSEINDMINADTEDFKKTGKPMSTPSFFIDGNYVDNSKLTGEDGRPSVETFSKVIDEAIKAKN